MKTAFLVTPYDLYESVLFPSETAVQLNREGYERCVIVDRTLASFVRWYRALSEKGIVAVPGLRRDDSYFIARDQRGLQELLKGNLEESPSLIALRGRCANYGEGSGSPLWETRYLRGDRKRFELYVSLKKEVPGESFELPDSEAYRDLQTEMRGLLAELPESFDLPAYTHSFPKSSSAQEFAALLFERLGERKTDDRYAERLKRELEVISLKGIQDYFLTVSKILQLANEAGCWIGPGRGSAAGSLVSYLLGITKLDPVREELYFERFLSVKRDDPPDIDIDVEDDLRPLLLERLRDYFGADRFSLIRTVATFGFKGAAREMGRKLGIDPGRVSRLVEWSKEGKVFPRVFSGDSQMEELYRLSKELTGLYSGFSIHAAGVIVSAYSLKGLVPLEEENGLNVSLWDMASLQSVGLQKIDILGLRNLTVLKRLARGRTPWAVRTDNAKTYDILKSGHTSGIFQLEGRYATKILKALSPSSLKDISVAIALNRPGPIKSGISERYMKMMRVPGELEALRQRASPLSETNGFLVYQEQVLNIAGKELALPADDGELLRRALSKKDSNKVNEILLNSPVFAGFSPDKKEKLYSFLIDFSGYAFNKSHSLSYALIAYWLAYFKANYPERFYLELFGSLSGQTLSRAVAELRNRGLEISMGADRTGAISLNLPELLGYREMAIEPEEESFFAFVRNNRRRFQAKDLEKLIKSGYCDTYGSRRELLKNINDALSGIAPELKSIRSVFGYKEEIQEKHETDTPTERAMMEIEVLGFNIGVIDGPEIDGEYIDTDVTSAVAGLKTGVAAFKRVDYLGKSYITDGRTFVETRDHIPLQGYAVFTDGRATAFFERVSLLSRIVYGRIDRRFLKGASRIERVIIRINGKSKILDETTLNGIEADEIVVE